MSKALRRTRERSNPRALLPSRSKLQAVVPGLVRAMDQHPEMFRHIRQQISRRALVTRINRALAKQGQALRRCRQSSRWHPDLGDYYAVDLGRNGIVDTHVDLVAKGRELGVLRPSERLVVD